MLSCYFRPLRLGGVLTSPQAAPSGLQMTPPSLLGTENPGKHGSPDFILIITWCFHAHHTSFIVAKAFIKMLVWPTSVLPCLAHIVCFNSVVVTWRLLMHHADSRVYLTSRECGRTLGRFAAKRAVVRRRSFNLYFWNLFYVLCVHKSLTQRHFFSQYVFVPFIQ